MSANTAPSFLSSGYAVDKSRETFHFQVPLVLPVRADGDGVPRDFLQQLFTVRAGRSQELLSKPLSAIISVFCANVLRFSISTNAPISSFFGSGCMTKSSKEPPSALMKSRVTVSAVSALLREKRLPPMRCAAALIAALSATRMDCIDIRVSLRTKIRRIKRKHQLHAPARSVCVDALICSLLFRWLLNYSFKFGCLSNKNFKKSQNLSKRSHFGCLTYCLRTSFIAAFDLLYLHVTEKQADRAILYILFEICG